jgi:hypothetical protein
LPSDASPYILVAAVTSVLREALQGDLGELVDEHFLIDLDILLDRAEAEIEAISQRNQLHVV